MSVITKKKISGSWKGLINLETFDSAYEMVESCKIRKITSKDFDDMAKEDIHKSWHGVNSYQEALDILKNGYQPVVDKLKGALNVNIKGEQKRFKFFNDVQGFAPIVPLVLNGVPNCYSNMAMRPMKNKVISVYYDITASCRHSADEFIRAGKDILEELISLEKQGFRVNLYAVQSYSDGKSADVVAVKIKSSSQPLDLKRTSFPLTHPAFFRVIGFDWYSKVPGGKFRGGYGHGLAYDNGSTMEIGKQLFGKDAIYICAKDAIEDRKGTREVLENVGGKA